MTTPTGQPPPAQPPQPQPGPSGSPNPMQSGGQQSEAGSYLLNSPFAKMFAATGAMPTGQEIQAIINGILQQQITLIQKQQASWQASMRKLGKQSTGDDDDS